MFVLLDYDDKEDHATSEEPTSASTLPLDDRYDAVTEAKSILNTWLQKKTEIDHEEFLFSDETSLKVKLQDLLS